MQARTLLALWTLASMTFAFNVVFVVALLVGTTITSALIAGELAVLLLAVGSIVMNLVPATIIQEDRLTIKAPREVVYAALADPHSAPRRNPAFGAVDDLVGEPGVVGTRWRMTTAKGEVFAHEVVGAEPPTRLVIQSRHVPRRPWQRIVVGETEHRLLATAAGTKLKTRMVAHTVLGHRVVERLRRSQVAHVRRWLNERFREELEAGTENREVALPG